MTSNSSRSPRTRGGRAASRESTGTNGTSTGSVATSRYATPEPEPLPEPRLEVDQAESSNGPPSVGLLHHIYTAPDFIISYEGSSQYEAGGVSACGLAALNCVRVILGKEQSGIRAEALLRDMTSRETFQEIMSICAGWSGSAHLEVEEIARIPLFQRCFSSAGTFFERPGIGAFKSMLQHLQASVPDTESAAVVITRPPEIVACMKIATPFGGVFVIFDSHPRPSHPNGAAFVFNTSLDTTAKHLSELMAVDRRLLSDRDMQWQTQLLANFSGLFLKAKQIDDSLPTLHYTIYDLSLQLLDLQGQTAELKSSNNQLKESMITMRDDNSLLVAENAQLQEEMIALRRELAEEKRRNERNGNGTWFSSVWSGSSSSQGHSSSSKGKSKEKDKEPYERWTMGRPHHQYDLRDRGISTWSSTRGSRSPPRRRSPPRTPPRARSPLQPSVSPSSSRKDVASPPGFHPPADVFPRKKSTEQLASLRAKTPPVPPEDEDLMLAQRLHMQFNSAAMADANLAARLQREFEAEDSRIFQEQRELQQYVRPTFECQVCFEETPEDDIARISECDHLYCRDCLRGHIMNRVGEHRYPILCPSCTASPTKTPSVITDDMVRVIGIPEREYAILEEMSLASFSIMLHCRQCQNSSFVARDEYDEVKVLECPLPACHYMWCKQCQQPATSETEHSCDGSKELENLMSQRGWKYCPGCKTPIQKETGCNHMTCTSPGCNMHFCYRCGGDIIASAVSSEVRSAISSHYARCSLFEELPDRAVPP